MFLFSMTIGVQAGKITNSPYPIGAAISVALALLYFMVKPSDFFARFGDTLIVMLPSLGLLIVFVSAIYSGELPPLIKVSLLIAIFFVVGSRVPALSISDILTGLMIFAVIEFVFVVVTRTEWNANTLCNHIMFATLCGAAASMAFKNRAMRNLHYLWILAGLATAFVMGSRTAVVGTMICVGLYWAIQKGNINRVALRYIFVLGLFCAFIWSGDVAGGLAKLAKDNLGSKNFIAQFFLVDKSEKKIDTDFFDRKILWQIAYQTMLENPFLGVGYDQSLPNIEDFRAHSAYLEIGYQCGVIAMLVWSAVYFGMVNYTSSQIRFDCHDPIVFLAFTSSCYLLLAGLMESSGMMSLGTPGNWVAISTYVYLKCRPTE